MTTGSFGRLGGLGAAPATPGRSASPLRRSDRRIDPAAPVLALDGDDRHGSDPRSPRPAPARRRSADGAEDEHTGTQPHPRVYLAIDTVTGEVLWHGAGRAPDGLPQAYDPAARPLWRDDEPHGLSRLV